MTQQLDCDNRQRSLSFAIINLLLLPQACTQRVHTYSLCCSLLHFNACACVLGQANRINQASARDHLSEADIYKRNKREAAENRAIRLKEMAAERDDLLTANQVWLSLLALISALH